LAGYPRVAQPNKVKEQESSGLKKLHWKLACDGDSANVELSAVVQYLAKLNNRCQGHFAGEKAQRRDAEIAEIKEASSISSKSAFLQQHQTHRTTV